MPGNIIKINNSDSFGWYVDDSRMEDLIALLNLIGFKDEEATQNSENEDLDARISMLESVVEDNYTRINIIEAILHKEYSDKKLLKEGISTNMRW